MHTGNEREALQYIDDILRSTSGSVCNKLTGISLCIEIVIDQAIPNPDISNMANTSHLEPALVAPSFCHPHVHLDKAFLLSHPKYSHLQIEKGTFDEAMDLTSQAKSNFEEQDLLERGHRLVNESVDAGVTHMRAFVEVDPIVDLTCLKAGSKIKQSYIRKCHIQLCAFAQLPLFTGDDGGQSIRRLISVEAMKDTYSTDVVGSTPYVEADRSKMEQNVDWLIDLALEHNKHLDFHLDYHLNPDMEPLVWYVVSTLKEKRWTERSSKTVVLGHCTRLSLYKDEEWRKLKEEIADLPISFVGLPTSDLYMMKTEQGHRGTLPVPRLIKDYGLNAAIGMNNIGNAFTPHGCCDPLYLANLGVGLYQAGTVKDAELLYECVSDRARQAIGCSSVQKDSRSISKNDTMDLVVLSTKSSTSGQPSWENLQTTSNAVYLYDGPRKRQTISSQRDASSAT